MRADGALPFPSDRSVADLWHTVLWVLPLDCDWFTWLFIGSSVIRKRITIFHVCRASDPWTAGTVTASFCRPPSDASRIDPHPAVWSIRGRASQLEPKTLMPDRFGKIKGTSRKTWSYLARDFVGVVHLSWSRRWRPQRIRSNRSLWHTLSTNSTWQTRWTKNCNISWSRGQKGSYEVCPKSSTRTRFGAMAVIGCSWSSLDDSKQTLSHRKHSKLTTSRTPSKPGKFGTTSPRANGRPVASRHATGYFALHVHQKTLINSWQHSNICSQIMHRDSYSQSYPRSCSNDDGKLEWLRKQSSCEQWWICGKWRWKTVPLGNQERQEGLQISSWSK